MKIIVCIKQVPDTTEVKINPVTGTIIREGIPSIMNPDDKGALEWALRLKDEHGAEVTAITMGPPQAEAILRESYAMGVDHCILLTDRAFAGADTLATSNALAGALRTLDYDLVIAGRQAIDGDTAQVGPQIAELLGLPQVSYVTEIAKATEGFIVKKETEEGYQKLAVEMPCLFTVLSSSVEPRYMTVRGICECYDKEVQVMTVNNMDVDVSKLGLKGSPTRVKKSFAKGLKSAGSIHEVEAVDAVELIVAKLKEKFVI